MGSPLLVRAALTPCAPLNDLDRRDQRVVIGVVIGVVMGDRSALLTQ